MPFIVDDALYKLNLTTKGWETARVLRRFEPKAPIAKASIIRDMTVDEDELPLALRA